MPKRFSWASTYKEGQWQSVQGLRYTFEAFDTRPIELMHSFMTFARHEKRKVSHCVLGSTRADGVRIRLQK